MRWSKAKPGSGWAMRPHCGIGASSSSQAGGPRAGAIGGGSEGSPIGERIRYTGAASLRNAMMRISAPPLGQTSGSDSNRRASRMAWGSRAGKRALDAGALGREATSAGGSRPYDGGGTQVCARFQNAVVTMPVQSR